MGGLVSHISKLITCSWVLLSFACSPAQPQHIADVVSANCAQCHGINEVPLSSQIGSLMLARVRDRTMPPGQVGTATPVLRHDARLSFADVQVFEDWAAAGYPDFEGATSPVQQHCDLLLQPLQAYTPPQPTTYADQYRCFLLPTAPIQGRDIASYAWAIDKREEMHHIVAVVVDAANVSRYRGLLDGWTCSQGLDVGVLSSLGSGGKLAGQLNTFGEDAVVHVPTDGGLVIQMHYVLGLTQPDRSGVCLNFADAAPTARMVDVLVTAPAELPPPQGVSASGSSPLSRANATSRPFEGWTPEQVLAADDQMLADCGYSLAAYYNSQPNDGSGLVTSRCRKRVGLTGTIRTAHIHMHTYGKRGHLRLWRSSGEVVTLLDYGNSDGDPAYNWAWEAIESLVKPVAVSADDEIEVECGWDNGWANQWSLQYGPSLTGSRAEDPATPAYVPGVGARFGEMCDGTIGVAVPLL